MIVRKIRKNKSIIKSDRVSTPKTSSTSNNFSESNAVNKKINKRRKSAGAVSRNDSKKNPQKQIHHQVRQKMFLLQMVSI